MGTAEVMNPVTCAACGSESPHGIVRGLCRRCYQRQRKTGTTVLKTTEYRFWVKVVTKADGCWLWDGHRNPGGYGQFSEDGVVHLAHRWSYERYVGPIPAGLTLDHLCRTPACVRPSHLEPVTAAENLRRTTGLKTAHYARGDREVCKYGHPMTPENSYPRPGRVNSFACRQCQASANRRYAERKKAQP